MLACRVRRDEVVWVEVTLRYHSQSEARGGAWWPVLTSWLEPQSMLVLSSLQHRDIETM